MNIVVKFLLGKIVELLVKKAEQKFLEAKAGADKKAYVINKLDEIIDLDHEEVDGLKEKAIDMIDDVVDKYVKK